MSAKDEQGRLLCGAAVGITANVLDRVDALVKAHVDVIVIDSAHGHSANIIKAVREIKEKYLFTEPIVLDKQVLIQRTEAANNGLKPIRNQLDLAGKTLYIPKDSPAQLRLQNLGHEIGDTIYVIEDELYSGEQLAIMVAKGDIDYAVCDQQTAALSQKQLPEIDIKTDISFTQLQSWAVRKDSPILLDSLNSWLEQIRKNGTFDKIYKKYYK